MLLGLEARAPHLDHDAARTDQLRSLERQRGSAEGTFGHGAPHIPVGAAAPRAMVNLMLAVHDVIATGRGIVRICLADIDHTRHDTFLPSTCRLNDQGL